MAATFELVGADAMLLRGTEGEAVADPRRMPRIDGFFSGQRLLLQEAQTGALASVPDLPKETDPSTTARYIRQVTAGTSAVPAPIAQQVAHILQMVTQL